jgi:micrococcal nuclease
MYEYKIKKIAKIVDGDTVDVIIDLGFGLYKKERVRIAGIDAPESRTRDLNEKKLGLEAKEYLTNCLNNANIIIIRTEKEGKYGRLIGWLYADGNVTSLNEQMINKGYAWAYNGGTKQKDYAILKQRRGEKG